MEDEGAPQSALNSTKGTDSSDIVNQFVSGRARVHAQARPPTLSTEKRAAVHQQKAHRLQQRGNIFNKVNHYIQRAIIEFAAGSFFDLVQLRKVCRLFKSFIDECPDLYLAQLRIMSAARQQEFYAAHANFDAITDAKQKAALVKAFVERSAAKRVASAYDTFFVAFRKLFNYNSTKENLPNKLLAKLDLGVTLQINDQACECYYELRTQNFSSHVFVASNAIQKFKFTMCDKFTVRLKFTSKFLNTSVEVSNVFERDAIIHQATYQKAFSFHAKKNFLVAFFRGDDMFLTVLFEIAAIDVLLRFNTDLRKRLVYKVKGVGKVGANAKDALKFYEKKIENFPYEGLAHYLKYQTDFELFVNVHNLEKKKNLYQYANTKMYPREFDDKRAAFLLMSLDEKYAVENTFRLDNKMGMSEVVSDLLLLDLVLKDRDGNYLICFSGYVRVETDDDGGKLAVQQSFDYLSEEFVVRKIAHDEAGKYSFKIIVIENLAAKSALLKSIEIYVYSGIIADM